MELALPMRTAIAWVVGIVVWLVLDRVGHYLGGMVGVPVMVFYDETQVIQHRFYEEEVDSAFTTFGLGVVGMNIMLATRAGMAAYHQMPHAGVSPKAELQFRAWFGGLALLCVIGALLYRAFGQPYSNPSGSIGHSVFRILELCAVAGSAWTMKLWYDNALRTRTVLESQLARISAINYSASRAVDECNSIRRNGGEPEIRYDESGNYRVTDRLTVSPPSA